jgi:putative membrane-bound dehydrogenase-like protein
MKRRRRPVFLLVLLLAPVSAPVAGGDDVVVPGRWTAEVRQSVEEAGGWAWYRSWLKPDNSFFTKHERNLFEESVGITIADLSGAHEVFVNGKSIGTGGAFPPSYRDGGGRTVRHKVPVGTLKRGEWNELLIRVYLPRAVNGGGFLGDAPFIMDYFRECVLAGSWEFFAGRARPVAAAQTEPPHARFDQFRDSNRVLGRTEQEHGPRLSPAESAAAMKPRDGLTVEQLLAEPFIAQPFHISFDERGRMWVTQSKQYPYPAGLRMISRDKYYRAHYDRIPLPPPHHDHGADLITIHESTKQNGIYDRHTVFLDGLNMANASLRGRGGVWVMHTPYLLFYPDADFDDVPDGRPQIHLAGFGMEDSHAIANGLAWGPDGWLYGAQGSTSSCSVSRPDDPPDAATVNFTGCMIWRYHPVSRAFEIFAEGGGNNFGLEFDVSGRLFGGHNGGGTRGFYFVQGGRYRMQGTNTSKYGPVYDPFAFGELPQLATTDTVVRFTHHGAFADGVAMPTESAGHLFSLDPLHNLITEAEVNPLGSTFSTNDLTPSLRSDDEAFRPVFVTNAPDGSLYVCDMYEYFIAHGQHYQNQIDPTTGRIYRLRGSAGSLESQNDLTGLTTDELMTLLGHPNKWHRQTAVRMLAEAGDRRVAGRLRNLVFGKSQGSALHALWVLHQIGELDSTTASACLQSPFSDVRRWAVRLLGDVYGRHQGLGCAGHGQGEGRLPAVLAAAVLELARTEADPGVLCQVLATARRLSAEQALALATVVLSHDELASDPYVPMMGWWVFEQSIPQDVERVLEVFADSAVWSRPIFRDTVVPRLARRLAVENDRALLDCCTRLFRLAGDQQAVAGLLEGLTAAVQGRSLMGLPDELFDAIESVAALPLAFRLRRGDAAAVGEAASSIKSQDVSELERLSLIRTLAESRVAESVSLLKAIAFQEPAIPDSLRVAALSGLGNFDDPLIGQLVVRSLPKLKGNLRSAALSLLSSRPAWTKLLLESIKAGHILPSEIPPDVVERVRQHREQDVRQIAARLLPPEVTPEASLAGRVAAITDIVATGSGNPYEGRKIFLAKCSQCHRLFHDGGYLGPALTNYQRDNLSHLLRAITAPSEEIREGYAYFAVLTDDGRSLTGFIVDQDLSGIRLRTLDGETLSLVSEDIDEIVPLGKSLMPAGLLDGLGPQQLRDFFAYLRIRQPIAAPATR